jgi:hypothetical protein
MVEQADLIFNLNTGVCLQLSFIENVGRFRPSRRGFLENIGLAIIVETFVFWVFFWLIVLTRLNFGISIRWIGVLFDQLSINSVY